MSRSAQPPAPIWPTQYTADTGCNLRPLHHQWGRCHATEFEGKTQSEFEKHFCEHAIFFKNSQSLPPSSPPPSLPNPPRQGKRNLASWVHAYY
jgi:hypothetical protein